MAPALKLGEDKIAHAKKEIKKKKAHAIYSTWPS